MTGMLDGLLDPELMARVSERQRIVARVAEQTGLSLSEARRALDCFAEDLSHEGHELH
ncbi:hypothetical protein [Bradyrhizobium sp. CW1]|uniref:hypothetical protein n=1 Tax=Bradyrhizobium sp. CW1 TaxID=2782686 RepID=UPI001FFEA153|nr:hypothetical protein [Bradyrhizobium sp. CW1]UPJ31015.1 hypothetical protein IVB54_19420 [Bradyrhizobium sp. CW1]